MVTYIANLVNLQVWGVHSTNKYLQEMVDNECANKENLSGLFVVFCYV